MKAKNPSQIVRNTKLNWYFPPTNGGSTGGFNDSGEEFFRSKPWEHTVREIIQNSLDAVDERRNKPVIVNISEKKIQASEIGATDLAGHIESALDSVEEKGSSAGVKFYKNALKVLNQSKIDVLVITDTNTTGLKKEKWDALIFDEGTSSKDGITAAGGSFGIGKNAPYVVSALKTVCYSTHYLDGARIEKFIARCKIPSHKDPKPSSDQILQRIGFGTKTKFKTNTRPTPTVGNKIYPAFRLNKSGSGIFIMGFDPQSKNWINEAKKSIAHNFFIAIHEKKLEVFINSDPINYQTLDVIFENGRKKKPARHYYHIIRDNTPKKIIKNNFGRFTLQVSIDDENSPNRIAYINRRGMMITDKLIFDDNPFHKAVGRGWAKYAAVIRADDDETDGKIRDMEPPNHQSIEYKRIRYQKNRNEIEEQLRDLRKEITTIISNELKKSDTKRDIDLPELADILPFSSDSGKESTKQGDTEPGLKPHLVKSSPPSTVNDEGEESDDDDGESDNPGTRSDKSVKGHHKHKKGHHKHKKNHHSQATLILQRRRIIRNKDGLQIAFTSGEKNGKPICFAIRPAGEQKMNEAMIAITSSQIKSTTNQTVTINNNRITMTTKYDERVMIDLKIPLTKSYMGYEIVELNSENKPSKGNEK